MDRTGEAPPAPRTPVVPPDEAPPIGMTLTIDAERVGLHGASGLLGGSPRRLLRFGAGTDALVRAWEAGAALGPSGAERRFARRLLDAGLAHPDRPPPTGAPTPAEVTVVVPARDRPRQLARLLGSLGSLAVVVVDDGSLDARTREVAARFGATYLAREEPGGPAAARNRGLEVVTTPFAAFLDSDCVATPGWLDPLLAHFADGRVAACAPRIVALGGRRAWWARYDRARSPLDLGPRPAAVRPGSRVSFVPSAALVLRRDALGGQCFDEGLRAGEDVDLVWRLAGAGWTVRYEPRATVGHDQRSGPLAMAAQRTSYGASAGPLGRRHPGDIAPVAAAPLTLVAAGLLLARRPGWACSLVAAGTAASGVRLGRSVPAPLAARLSIEATTRGALPFLAGAVRAYGPAMVVAALLRPRLGVPTLAIAAAPALASWWRSGRDLDPARFVLCHVADDLAYGVGVWRGALLARTAAPLVPRLLAGALRRRSAPLHGYWIRPRGRRSRSAPGRASTPG